MLLQQLCGMSGIGSYGSTLFELGGKNIIYYVLRFLTDNILKFTLLFSRISCSDWDDGVVSYRRTYNKS